MKAILDAKLVLTRTAILLSLQVWALHLGLCRAGAQAFEVSILDTGGSNSLVTKRETLFIDPLLTRPELVFSFGFTTEESIRPIQFLDSFSATLYDDASGLTAIFVTTDASGSNWAPPTDGTIVLSPDSILRYDISPPPSVTMLHSSFSYAVTAPIPLEFSGLSPALRFDLFDNLNGVESTGWYSGVVVVPEPRTAALLAALFLVCSIILRVMRIRTQ